MNNLIHHVVKFNQTLRHTHRHEKLAVQWLVYEMPVKLTLHLYTSSFTCSSLAALCSAVFACRSFSRACFSRALAARAASWSCLSSLAAKHGVSSQFRFKAKAHGPRGNLNIFVTGWSKRLARGWGGKIRASGISRGYLDHLQRHDFLGEGGV